MSWLWILRFASALFSCVVLLRSDVELNPAAVITDNHENVTNSSSSVAVDSQSKRELIHSHTPRYAWVSMVGLDATSIVGARVLSQSLSKHGSTADRILICLPGVADNAIAMLRRFEWQIYTIDVNLYDRIKSYPTRIIHEMVRIQMFNFTSYASVGYLPPHSMVTANVDHLLQCGAIAFCAAGHDHHHQIYDTHQKRVRKLLHDGKSVRNNAADNDNVRLEQRQQRAHEAVFDEHSVLLISPEHALYMDMFSFLSSAADDSASASNSASAATLGQYFYHYCKGNGYPIQRQTGMYTPPTITFDCHSNSNSTHAGADPVQCHMNKAISKSPCYLLADQGYNFHPSHSDHITAHWHWKQSSSLQHVHISIIHYSSYDSHLDHNLFKPWFWRYALLNGWMLDWNEYASIAPNLYDHYLVTDVGVRENVHALYQTPLLYIVGGTVWLSSCTALSAPCFQFFAMFTHSVSMNVKTTILSAFKWCILPLLLAFNIWSMVRPIKRVLFDEQVLPLTYPVRSGWFLACYYCYATTCLYFIAMCFAMHWLGNTYHPTRWRIRWPDYVQLRLCAASNHYAPADAENASNEEFVHRKYVKNRRYQAMKQQQKRSSSSLVVEDIVDRMHDLKIYILRHVLLKYVDIRVLIALRWCLWYLLCMLLVLWTIWILRWNDWRKLTAIVACECVIALVWLCYAAIHTWCQLFIFPMIAKFGEKYYDTKAFEKAI